MADLLRRLKERKLVQWVLVYLAGAWLIFQVLEVIAEPWDLSTALQRSIHVILVIGFFVALILAWYHGEKGRQRVSGFELLLIAVLCAIAAAVLPFVGGDGADAADLFAVERDRPAVAVLPFANLSEGEEYAFFADGFHEDVLNQLTKIADIDVLARQAVIRYRDSDKGPREIGRELTATAILEGSVQREGEHIRVTAQLIDCMTEGHVWSEQYDDSLSGASVFSIQSRIAGQVARAIGAVLSPEEESRIFFQETQSLSAYDYFLRAQAVADRAEKTRLLRLAIESDPDFAPAWGELGVQYGHSVFYMGWDIEWVDSAIAMAEKAISLAPDQPDGHRGLAYAHFAGIQYHALEQAARQAIERAPSDDLAIRLLAWALARLGQVPEAVAWNRRGIALNPTDAQGREDLTELLVPLALRNQAEEELEVLSTLDPTYGHIARALLGILDGDRNVALQSADRLAQRPRGPARWLLEASWLASMAGDYDKALMFAKEAADIREAQGGTQYGGGVRTLPLRLGLALMRTGREQEGRRRLEKSVQLLGGLLAAGADDPSLLWDLAATYSALGRRDLAIEWAQNAIDAGYTDHPRFVELNPAFESLLGDPEFERIIARIRADQQEMARRVMEQEAQGRSY